MQNMVLRDGEAEKEADLMKLYTWEKDVVMNGDDVRMRGLRIPSYIHRQDSAHGGRNNALPCYEATSCALSLTAHLRTD